MSIAEELLRLIPILVRAAIKHQDFEQTMELLDAAETIFENVRQAVIADSNLAVYAKQLSLSSAQLQTTLDAFKGVI